MLSLRLLAWTQTRSAYYTRAVFTCGCVQLFAPGTSLLPWYAPRRLAACAEHVVEMRSRDVAQG